MRCFIFKILLANNEYFYFKLMKRSFYVNKKGSASLLTLLLTNPLNSDAKLLF